MDLPRDESVVGSEDEEDEAEGGDDALDVDALSPRARVFRTGFRAFFAGCGCDWGCDCDMDCDCDFGQDEESSCGGDPGVSNKDLNPGEIAAESGAVRSGDSGGGGDMCGGGVDTGAVPEAPRAAAASGAGAKEDAMFTAAFFSAFGAPSSCFRFRVVTRR